MYSNLNSNSSSMPTTTPIANANAGSTANHEPLPYSKSNVNLFSKSNNLAQHNSYSQQSSPIHLAETGRRPSGNFSRMSFLYNNTFLGTNSNISTSNGSSNQSFNLGVNSNTNLHNQELGSPTKNSFIQQPLFLPKSDRTHFQAAGEILACDRSYETPNLVAIATPRNLQLLKISTTDITPENELVMKQNGRTKFGTISDIRFGHQQYGRYLAASTITGSIHIYNFDRGNRPKTILNGHQRAVNSIDFNHITPHILASGSQDGKILVWDLKASNSKPMMSLNCNADAVRCCSFSPKKENVLAAVFDSGVVEKWDLRKNSSWEKRINAHTGPSLSVHWHPELDYVVTGGRDRQLQVWNLGAGAEGRDPTHVINTSGPIFKAKWCKGRGNNSILNTDIAVSFFNDDTCVQIWNLNRKYIPKTIIDGHSAQITQIVWRTPKNLITCSKDKTLIQYDVTKESNFIDNIPNGSFAWNPVNNTDFVFVKQTKSQFEGQSSGQRPISQTNDSNNMSNPQEESNGINIISPLSRQESSMQLYDGISTSPNSLHSPILGSTFKQHQVQRQPTITKQSSYNRSITKLISFPAWVMPVHIPLVLNDTNKFLFLSTYYLIKIPEGSDIIDVCEYNSLLAASANFFRDSQTWRTIKTAIILDFETKQGEDIEDKLNNFAFEKIPYSRSDSRLGISFESESDLLRHRGSELSGSYASDYNSRPVELSTNDFYKSTSNNVQDLDQAIDDSENNNDDETVPNINETIITVVEESKGLESVSSKEDIKNQIDDKLSHSIPIDIENKAKKHESLARHYRYSFTGSSIDLDDEKLGSPLSLSGSPVIHKSHSRLKMSMSNTTNVEETNLITSGKSVDTRSSAKSHLTAIMKNNRSAPNEDYNMASVNNNGEKTKNEKDKNGLAIPWNPSDMIKQAINYSAEQADVLMCGTLSLLFENLYPKAIDSKKAEEWIYTYHETLLRNGYFNNAATILKIASETHEVFKSIGQTKTSVRTLCCHCSKPILNDSSKERYKERLSKFNAGSYDHNNNSKVEFGFWYCDRCSKLQGGCCYCNEPMKGNNIGLIGCGHQGHFGCFRTWFIEQEEKECPACGVICVK